MSYKRGTCLGFIMLLMVSHHHTKGKPLSSLQNLSRLLEDNFERSFGSDEADQQLVPTDSLDQLDPELQWNKNRLEQGDSPHVNEMTLQQLLNDPVGTSRRYRQRNKKGYSRGCFGVKLDRIGAFSGLGC
uniref:C-type natriuretic peptide 1 n=1 Tax=Aquarana catesbeiana TaxID=8400 RepID=ANFC_AQUCT|nr:RecName: Full=C-type natriuretic peptide 1; Short=CNP I; Flags: Precursor [Aquarana catesbeiana]BAA04235.1 C-type natriuretic peptide I precursor [Aquarana catesbeiana]